MIASSGPVMVSDTLTMLGFVFKWYKGSRITLIIEGEYSNETVRHGALSINESTF